MDCVRIIDTNYVHYSALEELQPGETYSMTLGGLYNPGEGIDIFSDKRPGYPIKTVVVKEESKLTWPVTTYVTLALRR